MSRKEEPAKDRPVVIPIRLISDEAVAGDSKLMLGMDVWSEIVAGVALGTDGPFTIGVFAPWGRGKTSVLQSACHLAAQSPNTHAFIVNAWEHEKHPDPLQPILADILRSIDGKLERSASPDKHKRLNMLKKILTMVTVGGAALALGAPALALAAPTFATEISEVGKSLKDANDSIKTAREAAGELIDSEKDSGSAGTGIRSVLGGAKAAFLPEDRIVVFIDDLDRCHPDKSLLILESIKHLLWVPGFVFILALDNEILENFLQRRYAREYGLRDNPNIGRQYLEKLVQLTLFLPDSPKKFEEYVEKLVHPAADVWLLPESVLPILVRSSAQNPRQAKRRINDLIVDVNIFSAIQGSNGQFNNDEIAACLAVNRLFRDRLPVRLVQQLAESGDVRHLSLISMKALDYHPSDDIVEFTTDEQKKVSETIAQGLSGYEELFQRDAPGWVWFENDALRIATREFLVDTRGVDLDAELSQNEILDRAIRDALDVKDYRAITTEMLARVLELELAYSGIKTLPKSVFGRLQSLTSIDLENTNVSDVSALSGLTSLISLDLSGTQVSDLNALSGLTALTSLDLSGTQVSDVSALSGLTSLTSLNVWGTQVPDVNALSGLTSLTRLDLRGTPVSDVSALFGLTSLTSLDLSGTQVSDVRALSRLTSLTSLNLWGTSVPDLSALSGLTSLKTLDIRRTHVSDVSAISGLTSLVALDVSGTNVSDVSALSEVTTLEHLTVQVFQIPEEQLRLLQTALPNLQIHQVL